MNTLASDQDPKANICGAQLSSLEDKGAVTKGRQDLMGVVIWSSDTRKSQRIAGQRLQK
jgi:hypothetical protein